MKQRKKGFHPVQRSHKRPGDFEYVWRGREYVPVQVQPRFKARGVEG